jgi:hypothetical protein
MERKKWTPKEGVTKNDLKLRERKKWQLALRRYVLDRTPSAAYAIYFGLSIEQFRHWIEIQFLPGLGWEGFGSSWQFDHVIPPAYFDFNLDSDLRLCWNFINIRVAHAESHGQAYNNDLIAARAIFQNLYEQTGYSACLRMVEKITGLERRFLREQPAMIEFIVQHREDLELVSAINAEEFNNLNKGMSLHNILLEREILRKFG